MVWWINHRRAGRVALPQKKSVDQGSFVGAVSGSCLMHLDQLPKRLFDLVAGTMGLALFTPMLRCLYRNQI